MTAELADELQAVPGADAQNPDDVHVVQASKGHHVLPGTNRLLLKPNTDRGIKHKLCFLTSVGLLKVFCPVRS